MVVNWLLRLIEIGREAGAVTVKGSVAVAEVLATEVAVIVGALYGDAGVPAGGVYITLVVVAEESVPQVVEVQFAPPAVRVQVTPLFVESFCTVALRVTAAAPAAMVEIGSVIFTVIAAAGVTVIMT
jgi:hypothetical protein